MFSEQNHFISYTKVHDGQLVTVSGLNYTPIVGYRSIFFYAKLSSGQITLAKVMGLLSTTNLRP